MSMSYHSPHDEGYSEDPLTMRSAPASGHYGGLVLPQWICSLPADERARIALQIISGLPTTIVEQIVEELRPRLCLDFIKRLPTEVCLRILSFLDPNSLIQLALASRDSKALALDWKLWESLYYKEGWKTVPGEIESFLQDLNAREAPTWHERPDSDSDSQRRRSKKRATPQLVSPTIGRAEDSDEEMDVSDFNHEDHVSTLGTPDESMQMSSFSSGALEHVHEEQSANKFRHSSEERSPPYSDLQSIATLTTKDERTGRQHLNWRHLYTQRRKLEANWTSGKYVNFQIPHPQHTFQAHSECIYTIQFQGRYLVSGSRDRSLRIWDMETRQLVLPPLIGHTGSVLCLQFESNPQDDIIVSGSSDASVILWRFSTGKAIQTLKHAHRESVLNVRFDHRILVTCSKDKSIKIFNRRPLSPGELGYPQAQPVAPVPIILNNYGFNPSPLADSPVLKPYTLIGTLEGHGAAVNAVQIWNNEIVSASGDRNIKVWDWTLQACNRTVIGHNKGIACVQYDGRRIVSGSSDNEVKVFDASTGLEVASLKAHSQLVRTVQAGFGDLPDSTNVDLAAAKMIDNQYFAAVEDGSVSGNINLSRSRARNAGSSKPEHIMAYGAHLPPGGGGGQYGRIVSGSYDESVIIWRRDREGAWKVAQTFKQEDAARAASRNTNPVQAATGSRTTSGLFHNGSLPVTDPFYHHFIDKAVRAGPNPLRQLLHSWPGFLASQRLKDGIASESNIELRRELAKVYSSELSIAASSGRIPPTMVINNLPKSASLAATMGIPSGSGPSFSPGLLPHVQNAHANLPPLATQLAPYQAAAALNTQISTAIAAANATAPQPNVATVSQPAPNTQPNDVQHQNAILHAHMLGAAAAARREESVGSQARVFKLQYDARRIVACSQTAIIVGWDFAAGDEEIIEASRFYGAVD